MESFLSVIKTTCVLISSYRKHDVELKITDKENSLVNVCLSLSYRTENLYTRPYHWTFLFTAQATGGTGDFLLTYHRSHTKALSRVQYLFSQREEVLGCPSQSLLWSAYWDWPLSGSPISRVVPIQQWHQY